jgi:hypothetical protein
VPPDCVIVLKLTGASVSNVDALGLLVLVITKSWLCEATATVWFVKELLFVSGSMMDVSWVTLAVSVIVPASLAFAVTVTVELAPLAMVPKLQLTLDPVLQLP